MPAIIDGHGAARRAPVFEEVDDAWLVTRSLRAMPAGNDEESTQARQDALDRDVGHALANCAIHEVNGTSSRLASHSVPQASVRDDSLIATVP